MTETARSYLDHNATSPVRPEVVAAVAHALALPGNPSSIHTEGRAARQALSAARESLGRLIGCEARQVTFTSGGTEAANALLSGALRKAGQPAPTHLLVSATEHPCVTSGHRFSSETVRTIAVDADGVLQIEHLREVLGELADESLLITVHAANNETGVIQPLRDIVSLAREHGRAIVHSDAVQAAGKVPLEFATLGLDALSVSGHKFAAPKGVGAFALADGVSLDSAFIRGGGQEARLRCGTENLPGIAGMGEAANLAHAQLDAERARLSALRDDLEAQVLALAPDAVVFGKGAPRLPNTLSFAVPGLEAATALIAFDLAGLAVSSGSACSSGKVAKSTVLSAMAMSPALAAGALRVSFGWNSTEDDGARFLATFERVLSSLYSRRGVAA